VAAIDDLLMSLAELQLRLDQVSSSPSSGASSTALDRAAASISQLARQLQQLQEADSGGASSPSSAPLKALLEVRDRNATCRAHATLCPADTAGALTS
jgi:hypothetical protein